MTFSTKLFQTTKGNALGAAIMQVWAVLSESAKNSNQLAQAEERLLNLADQLVQEFPPGNPETSLDRIFSQDSLPQSIDEIELVEPVVEPVVEPAIEPVLEPTEPTEPTEPVEPVLEPVAEPVEPLVETAIEPESSKGPTLRSILTEEDASTLRLEFFEEQGIVTIDDALRHPDLSELDKIGTKTRDRMLAAIQQHIDSLVKTQPES